MTRLLRNVTGFMRPDQPLTVRVQGANLRSSWPVHIEIGPGGDDTIDLYASLENARRLRDALTQALDQEDQA